MSEESKRVLELDAKSKDVPGHAESAFLAFYELTRLANTKTVVSLARQVEALEAEREWRPIESAPKDGTTVLLWDEFFGHQMGYYGKCALPDYEGQIGWTDGAYPIIGDGENNLPTHWQSLPEPPK